jgi:hypothetical protein
MTECIEIIWLMILLMTQSTSVGGSHVFDYISLYGIMYDLHVLSHRFRMNRELFVHIINVMKEYDDYFMQMMNATGQFGLKLLSEGNISVPYANLWNACRCYR